MKTLISLSMLFAVTVAGCASETPGDDGDGGGDGGGGGGGEPQPVPTTPEGTYRMQSEFDLATNIPGTAGTVATYFIQATDDPDDPTKFIVEKVLEALPSGSIKNALQSGAPYVTGYLNDRLVEVAPSFVGKVIDLGNAFGQVTKDFGVIDELQIDAAGAATKTVKGLRFEIDGTEHELAFADHGITETRIDGLTVTLAKSGQLEISEHKVPMKYGQVMRLALDQAIIPMIDPASSNLGELFQAAVNCTKVGKYIYDAIGFGSASTFESACKLGLTSGANALYNLMNNVDTAALELGIAGTARGVDKNRDGKMDEMVTGAWTGNVSYHGTPAPLSTAKFFGARM